MIAEDDPFYVKLPLKVTAWGEISIISCDNSKTVQHRISVTINDYHHHHYQ